MARRSITLLVAGLLAAAGCVGSAPPPPPPRPTQICGQTFNGSGHYRLAYYNLGHANTGWVTADGFAPIRLADGRTAWWMSDTTTGTANPDNSVSGRGNVHNSVVWQEGSCLRPQFGNPEMMPNSGGAWYWPGSTVVSGSQMLVFAYKLVPAAGDPGFDWRVVGTAFARYSLPNLQLIGGPTALPGNPDPSEPHDAVPWGIRSFLNPADGKVYLYGTTKHPIGIFGVAADAWLARAPFNNPTQLEYFTNPAAVTPVTPAWSTNFADAKPMTFTKNSLPDSSPPSQLSVVPYGSGYLAGAFAADVFKDGNGDSLVWAWTSNSPQGPWSMVMNGTNPRTVATFHNQTSNQIAYDARIAPLSGGAGWTVVYSRNDPDPAAQQQNWTLYRGEFEAPTGLPSPP
jgi:hypothetical protein